MYMINSYRHAYTHIYTYTLYPVRGSSLLVVLTPLKKTCTEVSDNWKTFTSTGWLMGAVRKTLRFSDIVYIGRHEIVSSNSLKCYDNIKRYIRLKGHCFLCVKNKTTDTIAYNPHAFCIKHRPILVLWPLTPEFDTSTWTF